MARTKIIEGSGNVFADVGLPNPESELAKAELVLEIARSIKALGLTQTAAAKRLGLDQPKISALLRGHWEGFSIDRLCRLLNGLKRDVVITVRPTGQRRGRTLVKAA